MSAGKKRLRVAVSLVVELDRDAWAEYQGIVPGDVYRDVRQHVLHHVQGSAFLEEANATVTFRTTA